VVDPGAGPVAGPRDGPADPRGRRAADVRRAWRWQDPGRLREVSQRTDDVSGELLRRHTQGAEARCSGRGRVPPGGCLPAPPAGVLPGPVEECDPRDG